jgi:signal transduction histidine kinase
MPGVPSDRPRAEIPPESAIIQNPSNRLPAVDFQLLFRMSSELVAVFAPDSPRFTLLDASEAYLSALGTSRSSAIGRGISELFPAVTAASETLSRQLCSALEQAAQTRAPHELSLQHDGWCGAKAEGPSTDARHWAVRHAPVSSPDGGFAYIVQSMSDVTLARRAELGRAAESADLATRIIEQTTALADANRELDAFSYSVSHDLRAPLRAIDGFSQALLSDYSDALDEQARHYLERVRTGAQRMSTLIDGLLALSRLHRAPLRRSSVDLSRLAEGIGAALVKEAPERAVELRIEPGLRASADPELAVVLLQSLLGNAWKFTSKQARATISVGRETCGDASHFFVRDDGAGFDMAYAGTLFSPFQRMHKSSEFDGIGIGLCTVQRIAMRHGGRVWAEARVREGAVFRFTFGAKDE